MSDRLNPCKQLWDHLRERRELVQGDDGQWLFWPDHWHHGALTAFDLQKLASCMESKNKKIRARFIKALEGLKP